MKNTLFILFIILCTSQVHAQTTPVRIGAHPFTIQWIAFNKTKPGTADIRFLDKGMYSIRGEQRDNATGDFVKIDGTFRSAGRTLNFDGTIISRVSHINDGKACTRTGQQVFKATGIRKYWRLQQMLNCDGETTDYIDIFF